MSKALKTTLCNSLLLLAYFKIFVKCLLISFLLLILLFKHRNKIIHQYVVCHIEKILILLKHNIMKSKLLFSALIIGVFLWSCKTDNQDISTDSNSIDEIRSKYNTEIPDFILTPDQVETRIGTLNFFDGIPTKETAKLVYDNLDFLRGIETFLNGIPATSIEGIRRGLASLGAESSNQVVVFDQLMDSNPLFLTGNTSTCLLYTSPSPRD